MTAPASLRLSDRERRAYDEDGFFLRPAAFPPDELADLRAAAERVVFVGARAAQAPEADYAIDGNRYLEAGGSFAALQEILGHRSPVTTQRYSSGREALIFREAAGMELTSGYRSELVAQPVAVESGAPHQVQSTGCID